MYVVLGTGVMFEKKWEKSPQKRLKRLGSRKEQLGKSVTNSRREEGKKQGVV